MPFFNVKDIEASLQFYVDGLSFTITRSWKPEGRIRSCWLERGHAAIMLQLNVSTPFVGNDLWVTSLTDPDGYRLEFESPTDVPEETVY